MRIGPGLETVKHRQYERQAANHGRAITEAMVEVGLAAAFLVGGDLLDGKIDFTFGKVWALFTPLLPVMIFIVPFFAVSLTQPIRDVREAAERAERRPWFHGPSLARLLFLALVTVFALVPLIKQYEAKVFGLFGLEFRLPDLPFQYGASLGRYVIALLLVAWVTSKIAHHMAVAGSDIPTNENDRVMLATYSLIARIFRGFIRFCKWMRRKAREHKNRPRDPVITDAPRPPASSQRPPSYAPPPRPPAPPMPVGTMGATPVYQTVQDAERATAARPMIIPPPPGGHREQGDPGLTLDDVMDRTREDPSVLTRGL